MLNNKTKEDTLYEKPAVQHRPHGAQQQKLQYDLQRRRRPRPRPWAQLLPEHEQQPRLNGLVQFGPTSLSSHRNPKSGFQFFVFGDTYQKHLELLKNDEFCRKFFIDRRRKTK